MGPKTNIFKDTSYFVIRALVIFLLVVSSALSKQYTTSQTINLVLTNSRLTCIYCKANVNQETHSKDDTTKKKMILK